MRSILKAGTTIVEIVIVALLLVIIGLIVSMALDSSAKMVEVVNEKTEMRSEEQRVFDALRTTIPAADPGSFHLVEHVNGTTISFSLSLSETGTAPFHGGVIMDYDESRGHLRVIEIWEDGEEGKVHEVDDVSSFGFYYHKKFKRVNLVLNEHKRPYAVRTEHRPNAENGKPYIDYNQPPFVPMELLYVHKVDDVEFLTSVPGAAPTSVADDSEEENNSV